MKKVRVQEHDGRDVIIAVAFLLVIGLLASLVVLHRLDVRTCQQASDKVFDQLACEDVVGPR